MNSLQLVLKQMRQRALSSWLTLLSVTLGVGLAIAIMVFQREGEALFSQADFGYGVAVDNVGNITVTGKLGSSVDFGGGPLPLVAGAVDVFVANFTPAGTHRWSKCMGVGFGDAKATVADAEGNSIVTGSFTSTANFSGNPVTSSPTNRPP